MKKIITSTVINILVLSGLLLAGLLTAAFLFSDNEIAVQSLESRTVDGNPVYNKISYQEKDGKDIWMMNQSHSGFAADTSKWERLAIIVQNKKVSFYQIQAGELVWEDSLLQKQVPYRASCFICHNNGPRAIRPDSRGLQISWANNVKIFFWNLKIKSYGKLEESAEMTLADQIRETPFRHREPLENQELNVATCVKCHSEEGLFSRNKLKRQQAGTIEFLVKNNLMPPPGFFLTQKEQRELKDFISGF